MKWNVYLLATTLFITYTASLPTTPEPSSNATSSTNRNEPLHKTADKPLPETWAKHGTNTKEKLVQWLIEGCNEVCLRNLNSEHQEVEYEGYDGYYNNLARPDLGAVDTPLLRRWPAAYKDGVYQPRDEGRPEPLELSENLLKSNVGKPSITGKNALLVYFGQQVVEEILDAQRAACPPEYFNIRIPSNHKMYGSKKTMMPVLRTRYDMHTGFSPNNPRQQLNEITPWLDGGLVYGTTKTWADHLRMNDNGTLNPDGLLLSSEDGRFPAVNTIRLPMANPPPPFHHKMFTKNHETLPVSRFFRLGNPRGNENPYLLTFGILWFRWHNHLARFLRKEHPEWNGEKVYNEARKWVIATQQHIVVNTWLTEWLGEKLPTYKGYDPSVDPQIDQFFQAAAFRFGHTLVTPGVILRDYSRNGCGTVNSNAAPEATIRTCNSFWRPQDFIDGTVDIDHVLMGMAFQLCEQDDNEIVEDLRGNVFGPLEFSRRDLMALNIQRGRDHGLPDYNSARKAFGLKVINDTNHFPALRNEKLRDAFMRLHKNSFDDIDVWIGGILETDNGPGELFRTIIKDQFTRIRNGDRFWYANRGNNLFTEEEIKRIEALTIYDIILSVTKMDHDDIQPNPFTAPDGETVTSLGSSCTSRLANNKINCFKKLKNKNETCYFLYVNISSLESCTELETYDYFSSSELPYIFTYIGIGTVIFGFVGTFCLRIKFKQRKQEQESQRRTRDSFYDGSSAVVPYSASEWIDRKSPLRPVVIIFDKEKKQIQVRNQIGQLLRVMDLTHNALVTAFVISDGHHVILRVSNDYDLVLKFDGPFLRTAFLKKFEEFTDEIHKVRDSISMNLSQALRQAITRKDRQKRLDMFFRVVFSQAFSISHSEDETLNLDSKSAREIIYTELTMNEFAEALSMPAKSEFVHKMFDLVDKDKNGFISFREFADMLVTFYKGTAEDKAKLMFDMYDINGTGQLTLADFKNMIRSLMETSNADVSQTDLDTAINAILKSAGLAHKEIITVRNFQQLLVNYKGKLGIEELNFTNLPTSSKQSHEQVRASAFSIYGDLNDIKAGNDEETKQLESQIDNDQDMILVKKSDVRSPMLQYILGNFEKYAREIFWMLLYTLVLLAVFAERAYYYSVEREHSGLRRIAGYGVTVTRGAASAMMFTYSTLLVTMCRNTITILRDTALHVYIPFDSAVEFHKYVAWWALFFTVMHTIGHSFNFYSISTQTSDDLTCLFRNFYHATHEIPKFHYWCWGTITGITGVLLVFLTAVIFIFALPFSRRNNYNAFWLTHSLYPVFFILMILHGAGRLIQPPFFYYFFLGPCVLFTIDKIISVRRKKVEIPVVKAELLPSNVTYLEFKKPTNFEYKSGQWVRIACTALNSNEYHPFTLSSAPHERNLTVHIRAVGPWTNSIRSIYDPTILREMPLPKIHLDGPYGEGHQDWYQFEVAILIGGGIGVTPFASILKDIVFRSSIKHKAACKKVYFLWVTKTQKQFEWLVDMIREVEKRDEDRVVSIHIFITQFYQKFDLRTVLLYLCERHFQKVCDRSLLTGLRAVTHFGRPNFFHIFECIQSLRKQTRTVGVFSCGPQPMMQMVDKACAQLNKQTYDGPVFQHHFKNF